MKDIFRYQSLNTDTAALFLRLIFGSLFIYHGYTKLISFDTILPHFKDIIGIGSKLSLILVICAEFGCGILVLLGFFTRLTVIPIFITMLVAFFIVHKNDVFKMKELPLIFLCLSVVVFISGSGKYSADRLIQKKQDD